MPRPRAELAPSMLSHKFIITSLSLRCARSVREAGLSTERRECRWGGRILHGHGHSVGAKWRGQGGGAKGSGEVQETLELEPILVLPNLTWLWAFMEDNRGRERQGGKAQPSMFGITQGWGVARALGARGPVLRGDQRMWWMLVGLVDVSRAPHGARVGFRQKSDAASSGIWDSHFSSQVSKGCDGCSSDQK